MKATKLPEIEEAAMNEKENKIVHEQTANSISMPSPVSNRLSSPMPTPTMKQSNPKPIAESLPAKGKLLLLEPSSHDPSFTPSANGTQQR